MHRVEINISQKNTDKVVITCMKTSKHMYELTSYVGRITKVFSDLTHNKRVEFSTK